MMQCFFAHVRRRAKSCEMGAVEGDEINENAGHGGPHRHPGIAYTGCRLSRQQITYDHPDAHIGQYRQQRAHGCQPTTHQGHPVAVTSKMCQLREQASASGLFHKKTSFKNGVGRSAPPTQKQLFLIQQAGLQTCQVILHGKLLRAVVPQMEHLAGGHSRELKIVGDYQQRASARSQRPEMA